MLPSVCSYRDKDNRELILVVGGAIGKDAGRPTDSVEKFDPAVRTDKGKGKPKHIRV